MHASNAFLNGAADTRSDKRSLLRALMASGIDMSSVDKSKPADERKGEEERKAPSANRQPGGTFENDPDDASNPNEVRERTRKRVTPTAN